MPRTDKHEPTMAHSRESSFVSLLTGWMQQGVENFFATQRILVDLVTRQNADVMHMLRERLERSRISSGRDFYRPDRRGSDKPH